MTDRERLMPAVDPGPMKPMKVLIPLFSPQTGTLGSLTRTMALARALQEAGHRVTFCASGAIRRSLEAKGHAVRAMPSPTMFGLPPPLSRVLERRSTRMSIPVREGKSIGSIWFVYRLSGMLSPRYLSSLVEAELSAAREEEADLLLTEMDPAAFLTARISGLPLAATYASVMKVGRGTGSWRAARSVMNAILARHGLAADMDPEDIAFPDGVLKLIPSIPELDGTPEGPGVLYAGNLLEPVSGAAGPLPEPGRRYVFCYLGTGSMPFPRALEVLPRALAPFPGLRCIVGGAPVPAALTRGAVEFVPYVSAERLLPHCDLTICHGGLNTITQSLEAGVPLLLFPGPIFERRFNAEAVQRNGAGAWGEAGRFTPEWLGARITQRSQYAPAARRLGARLAAAGGPRRAVRAMEGWLRSLQPPRRP